MAIILTLAKRRIGNGASVVFHLRQQFVRVGKLPLLPHETQVAQRQLVAVNGVVEVAQPRFDRPVLPVERRIRSN